MEFYIDYIKFIKFQTLLIKKFKISYLFTLPKTKNMYLKFFKEILRSIIYRFRLAFYTYYS